MIEHQRKITCDDGYELAASVFSSPKNRNWLIVNSAMCVRRRFYRPFALFMGQRGFNVVTYDYRGIADSAPDNLRRFEGRLYDWGEKDFAAVIDYVSTEFNPASLSALGHSVGVQVMGLAANNDRLDAIVAVATQSGYWKHWHGLGRVGVFVLWQVLPIIAATFGRLPGALIGGSVSLPGSVARDWATAGKRPGYLIEAFNRDANRYYHQVDAPILALSIPDDRYAPRAATEALLSWYDNAASEIRVVDPKELGVRKIKHFGWFRPTIGPASWEHVTQWLNEVLPNQADSEAD